MTSYKEYEKISIGGSDIASLTIREPNKTHILDFVQDGGYYAYLCDEEAEIGNHYELKITAHNWVWIYDDFGVTKRISAKEIRIYRAREFGCIIQAIN